MKLEDCKPGVRVMVYPQNNLRFTSEIVGISEDQSDRVWVKGWGSLFHPQQLRKLVKRKRPELMVAVSKITDDFGNIIVAQTEDLESGQSRVEAWKAKGCDVWLMVGKKRL
jgi:hypothetical protein